MARIHISETPTQIGKSVELAGWVDNRRDHGKLIFLDLRDESGMVQMVVPGQNTELFAVADKLRSEWVILIEGLVKERPKGMQNANIPTGTVEIEVTKVEILSSAETPPIDIAGDGYEIGEEVRLEYRYLDLRRARLQKNLRLRSKLTHALREYLTVKDFVEIETPYLTKSTPEGSRDFLVPSRMQPGKFYALPQSPQQYKQLLMASGFEKYFQFARAMRDEDLRADRAFEHTQLDMEMAFVGREDVLKLIEEMMIAVVEKLGFTIKEKPFPRFSYKEALEKFGADKFDLRTPEEKAANVQAFAWVLDFPFFEATEGGWTFSHNPFSAAMPESHKDLMAKTNIENIVAAQYDLVLNGFEAGGGSVREHRPEVLKAALEIMGFAPEKIESEYGHMMKAFSHGVPPHGGLAVGLDRLVMCLLGETAIREIQAFPMTAGGKTAVMDAPSEVTDAQLKEVGLELRKKK
ncbi:MAG: aspartate--tRNA ligase [Patescibacteria group bacterium]